jgi:dethiobiotin synthetase
MQTFVVTGTNTGIGKTIFSAGLTGFLNGVYWKPIQAGLDGKTDSEYVAELTAPLRANILPEVYRLKTPASPHLAARIDGINIDINALSLPKVSADQPLVVEGAGGLMVPLTQDILLIDIFEHWNVPVILCASTILGTINHTLLSLEALQKRCIPVLGIAFIGAPEPDTFSLIHMYSGIPILGRLPWLSPLTPETLALAFQKHFQRTVFDMGPCT